MFKKLIQLLKKKKKSDKQKNMKKPHTNNIQITTIFSWYMVKVEKKIKG